MLTLHSWFSDYFQCINSMHHVSESRWLIWASPASIGCGLILLQLGTKGLLLARHHLGRGLFNYKAYSSISSVYLKSQWLQLRTPASFVSPTALGSSSSLSHFNPSPACSLPSPSTVQQGKKQALSLESRRTKYTQPGVEAYRTKWGMTKMNWEPSNKKSRNH